MAGRHCGEDIFEHAQKHLLHRDEWSLFPQSRM